MLVLCLQQLRAPCAKAWYPWAATFNPLGLVSFANRATILVHDAPSSAACSRPMNHRRPRAPLRPPSLSCPV